MSSHPITPFRALPRLALPAAGSLVWTVAALVLLAGLHLSNALGRAINWDEFYHYTQINELLAGTLSRPMQTLQARMFGWVRWLPGDNIDQILAARAVMLSFALACAGAIYALALAFASRKVALVCVLAWLSAGFVLQHASSYRPDAIAAALLMGSLAVMTRSRLGIGASLVVAVLAALAVLVTIKSVLYAPAFAGIAWLRWQEAGRTRASALRLAGLAAQVAALFGLFYAAHSAFLPGTFDSGAMVAGSAGQMFQPFTFPYAHHALKAAATAPIFALALLAAPVLLWRDRSLTGAERVALASLLLPITSVAFYHNSAAYYYVFILPPVAVGCLIAFRAMITRYSLLAVSAVMVLSAGAVFATEDRETLAKQRQIVAAADQIFAEPVAYFDFPGMIGHFPKANAFLTPWGAQNYRNGQGETMEETLAIREVPLLLEDDPMFSEVLRTQAPVPLLLDTDVAVLRDTYIHFWGPYWLAGEVLRPGESREVTIRVPGSYTVRDGSIGIEGMLYLPGEVLHLDRGLHLLTTYDRAVRLIWGDALKEPEMTAPEEPYWTQF